MKEGMLAQKKKAVWGGETRLSSPTVCAVPWVPEAFLGHVAAAWKRRHHWCISLTPNNTKTMGRMTCHCFQWPIRRDLTSSSYTTGFFSCCLQQKWSSEAAIVTFENWVAKMERRSRNLCHSIFATNKRKKKTLAPRVFWLQQPERFEVIQAEPLFLILTQEEKKEALLTGWQRVVMSIVVIQAKQIKRSNHYTG